MDYVYKCQHYLRRTLTDFLVAEIGKGNDFPAESSGGADAGGQVPTRDLLHAFSAFCSGAPSLEKSEQAQLVRVLSASKRPELVTLINRDAFLVHTSSRARSPSRFIDIHIAGLLTVWGVRLFQRFCKMISDSSTSLPWFASAAKQLWYQPNGLWNIYETYSRTFGTTCQMVQLL